MKQLIIFTALLACSVAVHAQGYGELTIDNSQNPCQATITMYAMDLSSSPLDGVGTIISNPFTVAAYAPAFSWSTVYTFSPGWSSIPVAISPTSTTFMWTDIQFTYDQCPASVASCGSPGTVQMSDLYLNPLGDTYFSASNQFTLGGGCYYAQFASPYCSTMLAPCYGTPVTIYIR